MGELETKPACDVRYRKAIEVQLWLPKRAPFSQTDHFNTQPKYKVLIGLVKLQLSLFFINQSCIYTIITSENTVQCSIHPFYVHFK